MQIIVLYFLRFSRLLHTITKKLTGLLFHDNNSCTVVEMPHNYVKPNKEGLIPLKISYIIFCVIYLFSVFFHKKNLFHLNNKRNYDQHASSITKRAAKAKFLGDSMVVFNYY